jgi:hypothetical protein
MTNLKNFLVQEAIDESHAKRLLDYQDKFHNEAAAELHERLAKAWSASLKELAKKHQPDADAIQDMNFKNPDKACVGLDLVTAPRKIQSSRFHKVKETSLSVKISLAFTEPQRKVIRKTLLAEASKVLKGLMDDWRLVFKQENPKGLITTLFQIVHHDDEVRFGLASGADDASNHYRTVFVVGTEYGKAGTKLRDHDLVYLVDLM